MEKPNRSWRATLADALLNDGEFHADTIHECSESDEDGEEAIAAAEQLVKDGLAVAPDDWCWKRAPGAEEGLRAAVKEG